MVIDRVNSVKKFIKMMNDLGKREYFYLPEEFTNEDFSTEPTCPEVIENQMRGFFADDYLQKIPAGSGVHFRLAFRIHFLILHLLEEEGFFVIGPIRYKYLEREELERYTKKYSLNKTHRQMVKSYLDSITNPHTSSEPMRYIAEELYGVDVSALHTIERIYLDEEINEKISVKPPEYSNMHAIDEKYQREKLIRSMIAEGKRREAGYMLEKRDSTRYFQQEEGNCAMHLLSLNIICKQALNDAQIPASYIEQLYVYYNKEIVSNIGDIVNQEGYYSSKMLDDYCMLARDYVTDKCSSRVKKIKNYVLLHYAEKILVEDLAEYLQITPNYLSAIFKKETGMTLINYINEVRINSSLAILTETDLPISEVSLQVGIEDYNYFSRVFKQIKGKSPTQYRKDAIKS